MFGLCYVFESFKNSGKLEEVIGKERFREHGILNLGFIEVQLKYNVMLVSSVQYSDSTFKCIMK